jgi:sterol desaturase/sphingolipid hydroxylase (fatty acid hydroxylase superfamily)
MDTILDQIQDLPPFAQHLLQSSIPVALDILRLSIWFFLLMAVFVPLERLFPVRRQKVFRRFFLADAGYYLINGILPKALLVLPMAVIALGLHHVVPGVLQSGAARLPVWARLAAALVLQDFGYYWGHRWMHEIPLLWRFHSIHHNAEEIDWLVNTHVHPLDIFFATLCSLVPMYALGFGQPMVGNQMDVVPLLAVILGRLWGFFIHANLCWRFGWLSVLISTPAFHHWHHTNDEHVDKNYASMLPVLDILFGSWYMPAGQWPPSYGIKTPVAPGLGGQLLQPFLPAREKAQ